MMRGQEARHISTVLRLCTNDAISLFDRHGNTYEGCIVDSRHGCVTVMIRSVERYSENTKHHDIVVCQALLKSNKMEIVLQKSIELGATRFIPFVSSRSIPLWDESKNRDKVRRWGEIITAALKQSGARPLPLLDHIVDLSELITLDFYGFIKFILWEGERNRSIRQVLSGSQDISKVVFMVGPEGGFSRDEIDCAQKCGFLTVGLGDNVLRAETVALAVLSSVQYERGWLG